MKYKGRKQSRNVSDRRGMGGGAAVGGVGLIVAIAFAFLTGNPSQLINIGLDAVMNGNTNTQYVETAEEKDLAEFVAVVLADTEDVWNSVFVEYNKEYVEPELVLFKDRVNSGCGLATSDTGPFYCPADQKVYIDLVFHKELKQRFKATGDFAMAYVVAHEVGHHVQNLLGISDQVQGLRGQLSEKEYNKVLKRLELQADYLAGVWAYYQDEKNLLDVGDIKEAMEAAAAVGDDRIQEMSSGKVTPDKFTHGTSEQRMRWFKKGYESGNLENGDTFAIKNDKDL